MKKFETKKTNMNEAEHIQARAGTTSASAERDKACLLDFSLLSSPVKSDTLHYE